MAVQPQHHRSTWTDERLDDLAESMRGSFARVDRRFDQVEAQHRDLKSGMDRRFDKVDERFDRMDERLSSLRVDVYHQVANLNRTMITGLFVIVGALFGLKLF